MSPATIMNRQVTLVPVCKISTEAPVGEDKSCLELVITREHQAVEIQWEAANPDFLRSEMSLGQTCQHILYHPDDHTHAVKCMPASR